MSKTGRFKLVLLADATAKARTLHFSRRTLVIASALIIAVSCSAIYGTSLLLARWLTTIALANIQAENQELHQHLAKFNQRLQIVNNQLKSLAQSDDQLRLFANIPRLDSDVRAVGVGGNVDPALEIARQDREVRDLLQNLDKIEREIKLQHASFQEIERQFAVNSDLLVHTPSIRPVEGGYVSSGFGMRLDPFTRRRSHHNGADISVERGTPVSAPADGEVIFAKRTPGLGNLLILDHGYGFQTAYGHLSSFSARLGQKVTRGQKIGEVGNTGRSTAPHLHYEVFVNGRAVDPLDYFFETDVGALASR
jgi:murein DD-endopeptidase MepM/ murein hydrolase activator NlpD